MKKIGCKAMIVKFVNYLLQNVEKHIIGKLFIDKDLVECVVIQFVILVQASKLMIKDPAIYVL